MGTISGSLQVWQLLAHRSIDCVESLGADGCEEISWRVSGVRGSVREDGDVVWGRLPWRLPEGNSLQRFGDGGLLCVCSRSGHESARFISQLKYVVAWREYVSYE